MPEFTIQDKNRVRRLPERGQYDHETIYKIIDDALLCTIGFVQDGQPFAIPALHARREDELLVHGASTSRLLKHIQTGNPVSINVTILDGIVLAKTVFNQSVNYRSVVLFGRGRLIDDPDEKLDALAYLSERIMPGVWGAARKPNAKELKATSIVAVAIESASAKTRGGPPKDEDEDRELDVWAGVLPVRQVIQAPLTADYTREDLPVPGYVLDYIAKKNR